MCDLQTARRRRRQEAKSDSDGDSSFSEGDSDSDDDSEDNHDGICRTTSTAGVAGVGRCRRYFRIHCGIENTGVERLASATTVECD